MTQTTKTGLTGRSKGKIVLAFCVADMLHAGHLNLFREAKKMGDYLIVCPHPSYCVKKYKRNPVIDTDGRFEVLRELKMIDLVIACDRYDTDETIDIIRPDLIVHGDDWIDFPGRAKAEELGIETATIPYTKGISTTKIIERIKNEY